ncbi:MAG: hypothetical protein HXY27_00290 [Hydrogenophilaceae bacterium]|nr:hypothetical protein [Hydrogenophilaceae bacterium]
MQGTAPKTETSSRVGEAITTPLVDLNLLRTKIPAVLIEARKSPYQQPVISTCETLTEEIRRLDEALGPDLDALKPDADPTLLERGTGEAGDIAIGAIKSAAVGWIPYRGWVRKLTGAERHSKEVASAISAGIVRRAYLKGLGQARGCPAPASPQIEKSPAS